MTNKTIFIAGYPKSGKSSILDFVDLLEENYAASTSRVLDDYCVRLLHPFLPDYTHLELLEALKTKDVTVENFLRQGLGTSIRELKIVMAENVLVPTLGRQKALLNPIRQTILTLDDTIKNLWIETIGGSEFEKMLVWVKFYLPKSEVMRVNMSSVNSEPDGIKQRLNPADLEVFFEPRRWYAPPEISTPYRKTIIQSILGDECLTEKGKIYG
jgi:hypothetical protein